MNDKEALTIIRDNLFSLYRCDGNFDIRIDLPLVKAVDFITSQYAQARGNPVDSKETALTLEIWAVAQGIERAAKEVYNGDDDQ